MFSTHKTHTVKMNMHLHYMHVADHQICKVNKENVISLPYRSINGNTTVMWSLNKSQAYGDGYVCSSCRTESFMNIIVDHLIIQIQEPS